MHYNFKFKTPHKSDKGKIFAWLAMISSIGFASFITVFAVSLSEKLNNEVYVGYYFAFIAAVSLIASLFSTVLLKKYSKVTLAKTTLAIGCIAFFLLTIAANIWHFLIFDVIRAVCMTLFLVVLAIFVRDFAKENELALAEGRYYLFMNIGWLIGPFVGGMIAQYFGDEGAFIFAGLNYLLALVLLMREHIIIKNPHLHDRKEETGFGDFIKNMKNFFSNLKLIRSFFIGFGLNFWWAIYKIYIPITIVSIGYGQDTVGLVVSAAALPLIFLEMIVAKKAQNNGVKEYMGIGYFWLAVCVLLMAIAKIPVLLIALMVLVNVGAAYIEPLHETLFFQISEKKDEERFYGIYNTSYPIANILAPLFGSFILSFTDINGLWIAAGIIFLVIGFLTATIKIDLQRNRV